MQRVQMHEVEFRNHLQVENSDAQKILVLSRRWAHSRKKTNNDKKWEKKAKVAMTNMLMGEQSEHKTQRFPDICACM